jgi:multidrug efflux pump
VRAGLWQLPGGFLPEEDTGELVIDVELPPGSTQAQTRETIARLEQWMKHEKFPVKTSFALLGWNNGGSGEQRASVFLSLDDWKLRGRENSADVVLARLTKGLEEWPGRGDAQLYPYNGTALPELGSTSGLDMRLVTRLEGGRPSLYAARDKLIERAKADPCSPKSAPAGQPCRRSTWRSTTARPRASASIRRRSTTRWRPIGSRYIDELARDGRVRRVILQADAPFRMQPEDLARLHVRNAQGQMVSLGAFATLEWGNGEATLERYNGLISVRINADVAPGVSTGTAMTRLESLVRELGPDYEVRWSGRAFEQQQSGTQAPWLFALSMLFIFLCLVALYESWTLPLAVLAIVPAGLVGAASAVWLRGLPNDVYFKVGVIVIMGLAAKNAILVVEYAEQLRRNGLERVQAATQAARQRLRPVVMTSLAFILGVVPLAISTGPGAGAQRAVGTGVLGGMLGATSSARWSSRCSTPGSRAGPQRGRPTPQRQARTARMARREAGQRDRSSRSRRKYRLTIDGGYVIQAAWANIAIRCRMKASTSSAAAGSGRPALTSSRACVPRNSGWSIGTVASVPAATSIGRELPDQGDESCRTPRTV